MNAAAGADVNMLSVNYNTALRAAAKRNKSASSKLTCVKILLESGAHVNVNTTRKSSCVNARGIPTDA